MDPGIGKKLSNFIPKKKPRLTYRICRTSLFDLENLFPQTKHKHGFSPVCVRRWHCKSEDLGNRALHTSHAYGFSPVCRRICTTKFDEFEKLRPQYEHKCLLTTASRSSGGT